jgi:hypothetical protein
MSRTLAIVLRSLAVALPLLALALALRPELASARTLPAHFGDQTVGSQKLCFTFGDSFPGFWGMGKSNSSECSPSFLVMPLMWDTPSFAGFPRTISVVGKKQSSANVARCRALNFNASGSLASQSSLISFTSTSYAAISLTLNSVPIGSFGFVRCEISFSSGGSPLIVNLDYLP